MRIWHSEATSQVSRQQPGARALRDGREWGPTGLLSPPGRLHRPMEIELPRCRRAAGTDSGCIMGIIKFSQAICW